MAISEQPILDFVNYLISFLDSKFASETKLPASKRLNGCLAFTTDLIKNATKSFYVVRCISHKAKDETLNSIATLSVSIQIDVFALKGSFNGTQYFAEPMSIILQQLISNYMSDLKFNGANANIRGIREMASSPAFPFEEGSRAYQSSLRYDFTIMRDYEVL